MMTYPYSLAFSFIAHDENDIDIQVLGAGVAGLAAIQAAKGLGAVVQAYDVRAAAREQVESMGGLFLAVDPSSIQVRCLYTRAMVVSLRLLNCA